MTALGNKYKSDHRQISGQKERKNIQSNYKKLTQGQ